MATHGEYPSPAGRLPFSRHSIGPTTAARSSPFRKIDSYELFNELVLLEEKKYLSDCAETQKLPQEDFLENLRFHDLRHEATTRLFELGLDMMEVASISGHKSLSMLRRYTHLRAEDLAHKLG